MKKVLPVLILVVLAAVGGYFYLNQAPAPVVSDEPEIFLPNFDAAESAKMGSFMYSGYYLMNEAYYIRGFGDLLRVTHAYQIKDGAIERLEGGVSSVDYKDVLAAGYLAEGPGKAVFFRNNQGEIGRITIGQEGHSILVTGGVHTMQVAGDKLYYTKGEDYRLFRSDLDGKGEEKVLDKEIFFPYVVGNFVVFQDDDDGESIHLYNMVDKSDKKILDGPAYSPNIVGNWMFCFVQDKETGYYQIVGVEFKEDGEFETTVFNREDGNWYAEMSAFHYVIVESSGYGHGALNFYGKNILNYGRESARVADGQFFSALPAWLLHNPRFNINGSLKYPYSSPYGYVRESDGQIRYYLFDKVIDFDGFYSEGSDMAKDVEKWNSEAGQ